jgi:hypothetical protein
VAGTPLFRQEVLDSQRREWLGPIIAAAPVSGSVLAALAFSLAIAMTLFLVFGHYTRRETVTGQLTPSAVKQLKVTRLVIAHRSETIASAKKIVTLNAGNIESVITQNESAHCSG